METAISVAARTTLYRTMVRIRAFENAAEAVSQGGVSVYGQQAAGAAKVRGPLHLATSCRIARLGAPRIPVSYSPVLEAQSRVSVDQIVNAARTLRG
jgi:hypothetical protein